MWGQCPCENDCCRCSGGAATKWYIVGLVGPYIGLLLILQVGIHYVSFGSELHVALATIMGLLFGHVITLVSADPHIGNLLENREWSE